MTTYKFNKTNFLEYLEKNFNVKTNFIMLSDEIINYLQQNNCSLESTYNRNEKVYIPCWIYKFIDMLNNSYIDITYQELFDNNILEKEHE